MEKDCFVTLNMIGIFLSILLIKIGNRAKHTTIYKVRIIAISIIMLCVFNILLKDLDFSKINLESNYILQMVNISGVFVGFIFTGISILFSIIGMNRLKSEFTYGFLDKVFHKSFLCVFSSLIFLIAYFSISIGIVENGLMHRVLIYSFAYSIFFIIWSLVDYFKLIFESKNSE